MTLRSVAGFFFRLLLALSPHLRFVPLYAATPVTKEDFELKAKSVAALGNNIVPGSPKYEALHSNLLSQWESLRKTADTSDDGEVSLDEWLAFGERLVNDSGSFEELIRNAYGAFFDILDLDDSQTVSFEEYSKVNKLYGLDEATVKKMFDELDTNHNGALTLEEYQKTIDWFFERLK